MKTVKSKCAFIWLIILIASLSLSVLGCGNKSAETSSKKRNKKKTEKVESAEKDLDTSTPSFSEDKVTQSGLTEIKKDLKIGQIAEDGDHYSALAAVRSLDTIKSALKNYSEDILDSQEVIYPIIEVYNPADIDLDCNTFDERWNIEVYVDSQKAPKADVSFLLAVDDYRQYQFYIIDSQRSILFLDGFVVEKGWTNMQVFFGNLSWSITPDDVSYSPYKHKSLFEHDQRKVDTEPGTVIYEDKDIKLIYDGFEFCTSSRHYYSDRQYAVFKFTINNISGHDIECRMWGWRSLCYVDYIRIDQYESSIDDIFDGYENISNLESLRSGMKAKVYIPYEIKDKSGLFECFFDTGYCYKEEQIGYVCKEVSSNN